MKKKFIMRSLEVFACLRRFSVSGTWEDSIYFSVLMEGWLFEEYSVSFSSSSRTSIVIHVDVLRFFRPHGTKTCDIVI
jgi:hypothetical protein